MASYNTLGWPCGGGRFQIQLCASADCGAFSARRSSSSRSGSDVANTRAHAHALQEILKMLATCAAHAHQGAGRPEKDGRLRSVYTGRKRMSGEYIDRAAQHQR